MPPPLLPFFLLLFFFPSSSNATSAQDEFNGTIGAILHPSSRAGKEEKIAMEMALQDFNASTGLGLLLNVANSHQDTVGAASGAMSLINNQQVQAILGMQSWQEAAFVADLGHKAQVPILSFADSTPSSASDRWPFLIRVAHNRCTEMGAIAAIVGSWRWRKVTVIDEDIDYTSTRGSIIPCLAEALREVGSEIDRHLCLRPTASVLSEELEKLKSRQCRVFIVHTSLQIATRLFAEAKRMGMMEAEHVWITTDIITSHLDFVNASVISSMEGVLGVKGYLPHTSSARFSDFHLKFRRRFRSEYPHEENSEPGIFALKAYDAAWAVANAMERVQSKNANQNHPSSSFPKEIEISTNPEMKLKVSANGPKLLETILSSDFEGLSGEFRFVGGELNPPKILQVVNVVGKSYRELGFWSQESGFSDAENRTSAASMEVMGQIFWPGGPWTAPRGWVLVLPTNESFLRIGVPAESAFSEFVKVTYGVDPRFPNVTGFSIDVFKAVVRHLQYDLPYKFFPFNGSYDSLIRRVKHKEFHAVVGDTSIVANRYDYVEFSQPYAESGLVMVVSVKSRQLHHAWMFMKPFSKTMWAFTALINVYNGFVVWLIETRLNQGFSDSIWRQLGTVLWFSFTTLFSLHREKLENNLARMAMLAWLFVALILTQSYTANLSSMLTLRGLNTGFMDVELLKRSKATIGCDRGSFVVKYLEEVLGFQPKHIKQYSSGDQYPHALSSGEIAAAFLRVPFANVLLAKYCNTLTTAGPTFDVGGFGFAFPKGSPLIPDISKAILQVYESGEIRDLKSGLFSSYNCSGSASDETQHESLSFWNFLGLFAITGGASSVALTIFTLRLLRDNWHSVVSPLTTAVRERAWGLASAIVKPFKYVKHRFFNKKMATNANGDGHGQSTEMTHRCDQGAGNQGHGVDLEEPTEFQREQHSPVLSPSRGRG